MGEFPSPVAAEENKIKSEAKEELTQGQLQELANFFDISVENKEPAQIEKEIEEQYDAFLNSEQGRKITHLVEKRTSQGFMSRLGTNKLLRMFLLLGALAAFELAPSKASFAQENEKTGEVRGNKLTSRLLDRIPKEKKIEIEREALAEIDVILLQNYPSAIERGIIRETLIKQLDSFIIDSAKQFMGSDEYKYSKSTLNLGKKYRNETTLTVASLLKGGLKVTTENNALETKIAGEQILEREDVVKSAKILDSFFRLIDKKVDLEGVIKEAGGFDDKAAKGIKEILLKSFEKYYSE
jgi:hypothetical protein